MAFSFQSNRFALIAFAIALGSFSIISPPAVAADIVINFNEDLLVKLPSRVTTIVVGNPPFIATSKIEPSGLVMLGCSRRNIAR